ncbi:MAG: glycosyltransferase [Chloroflexota bacterium]
MPKVSVLLPIYNAADTLPDTMASISQQSLQDYEMIAVDDGSTDATPQILADWAEKDKRIQVISIPHQGVITAANEGLAACIGEYVARMDADDLMHPDRLALQATYLDKHAEIGVVSCLVDGAGEIREGYKIYLAWLNSLVTNADIQREIFIESPMANPSTMLRKSVFQEYGGYQEQSWAEDYDLWLRMYLGGVKFGKVPMMLHSWRDLPDRLTRTDSRYSLENFIRAKAHYIIQGPLLTRDAIIVWGAGMMGKRFSKYLVQADLPVVAFVDVDRNKIGRTRRGRPIIAVDQVLTEWEKHEKPIILAAVGARGARKLIRADLTKMGLVEGQDWWGVA